MKKVLSAFVVALTMIVVMGSCSGSKQVAYFQNADSISYAASRMLYDAKVMPKDQLTITVLTTDPKASAPFNLSVSNTIGTSGQLNVGGSLQGYLVDNEGNINFPIVGKLHVEGLTKNQCEDLIRRKIAPYLAATENPVVTVRMASYRVTVIGEVEHPGVVQVPTEKMSVIEALAQSGDLTIYGKRNNVMLIREDATGQKEVHRLNLNDANLINSPYYYLQQNDVIYVQPNKMRAGQSTINENNVKSVSLWVSIASFLTSLGVLIFK